ncbi:MAG: rhamnan synthesis F family protein, partial [Cyanobacteria bacterium P01_A01_bin.17]
EICQYLENIRQPFDLFVNMVETTWTPSFEHNVRATYPKANVIVSQNRGRDIGGHLASMEHVSFSEYDVFGLLHTKKSGHLGLRYSQQWRTDLFSALLGSSEKVADNLAIFAADPTVGLVASRFWRETLIGERNIDNFQRLLDKFAIASEASSCEFISGTVMFVRPSVWQRLSVEISSEDFTTEAQINADYKIDGQLAHAVERIIGNLVRDEGMRLFWTDPDVLHCAQKNMSMAISS